MNSLKDICSWSARLNIKWFVAISICCLLLPAHSFPDNGTPTAIKKDPVPEKDRQTITIQVVSHKKVADAEGALKRLKSHDLDAIISYESVKDKGMFYRVYVGQFENRKTALAFANGLVDKGIISGFWIKKTSAFTDAVKDTEAKPHEAKKPPIEAQQGEEKIETVSKEALAPPGPIAAVEMATPPEISKSQTTDQSETAEALPEAIVQKEAAAPEIQAPQTTDQSETREILPETMAGEAAAPATSKSAVEKDQEKRRFSLGIKSKLSSTKKADDFKIRRTSGGDIKTWIFEGTHKYVGLVANFQLNDKFALESVMERGLFTKLELWQLSLGPVFQFRRIGLLTPFVRGGLVVGSLKWDDAPGDFDTGVGWEGGLGIYLIKSKVKIGIEASYQQMKYAYNEPTGQEVAATDDYLDMSGFALSGTLSYLF